MVGAGSLPARFHVWSGSIMVMRLSDIVDMTGCLSKVGVTVFVASSPGDSGSIPLQASKRGGYPAWLVLRIFLIFLSCVANWWTVG